VYEDWKQDYGQKLLLPEAVLQNAFAAGRLGRGCLWHCCSPDHLVGWGDGVGRGDTRHILQHLDGFFFWRLDSSRCWC